MIKTVVPNMALKVIDDAIQIHGGIGVSQDTPWQKCGRAAHPKTGRRPDGVPACVGRNEIKQYLAESGDAAATFRDG